MKNEKIAPELIEPDKNIELRIQKKGSKVLLKIIILNAVNLILIIAIIVLLNKLPALGNSLKEIRSASIAAEGQSEAVVLQNEIERNREKIDTLKALYVDQSGFVDFVGVVNTLKTEGLISDITFSGTNAVMNNKNQPGVPIAFVFQGSQDQINSALERFYSAPVLFNVLGVEYENVPAQGETAATTALRLSIFLLVDEKFPKN